MDWQRLATAVIHQRQRRGWWQRDLAARSGMSARTISRLESGRQAVSDTALLAVEHALGWERGSARRVLEGGRPKQVIDEDLTAVLDLWPRIPLRQRAAIRHMAEQLAE